MLEWNKGHEITYVPVTSFYVWYLRVRNLVSQNTERARSEETRSQENEAHFLTIQMIRNSSEETVLRVGRNTKSHILAHTVAGCIEIEHQRQIDVSLQWAPSVWFD